MCNNKGISLVLILVSLCISVVVIGVVFSTVLKKNTENEKQNRLVATHLSDIGFQEAMANVGSIEKLASDEFVSIPKTAFGAGWYTVNVTKKIIRDTMQVSLESIGEMGSEVVNQQKKFWLVSSFLDGSVQWQAVSKE